MKKNSLLNAKVKICHLILSICVLAMSVPMVAFADKKTTEATGTVTDIVTKTNTGLTTILTVMQGLFTGCATLVIGYVGFLFLFGGDEGRAKGKKQLIYIVAGFALCFLAASLSAWLKTLFSV